MQEKVAEFIQKHEDEQKQKEEKYRAEVISASGLISDEVDFVETTFAEYNTWHYNDSSMCKEEDGKYYVKKRLPIILTDEEFAALEKAMPSDKLAEIRAKIDGISIEKEGKSWAGRFLTVIAVILWVGGLIISISGANVENGWRKEFSFEIFMSIFIVYFISGCFALCGAELFKKLQEIVNLLKKGK